MTLAYKSALTYERRMKSTWSVWSITSYEVRMKYHVIMHCVFFAPKKILLLFPQYDLADHLKKEKRAGLNCWWNRLFQVFWASVCRHSRKPIVHTHERGGVWSSTSNAGCRRRLLYSTLLHAPTHRCGRVMVEQLQHRAGVSRYMKYLYTPAPYCSCLTWTRISSCSGTWKFLILSRNFKNSRATNWNSEGDNLNAEDFDGL